MESPPSDDAVPCHFLCPISLQLMTDPVTVATGITYDRRHIHHWLFSRNRDTCPVTNQTLAVKDLTPNLTLRRLIHSWSTTTNYHNIAPIHYTKSHISQLLAAAAAESTSPTPQLIDSLSRLRSVAAESEPTRIQLRAGSTAGFLASVVIANSFLELGVEADHHMSSSRAVDESLAILHHIGLADSDLKKLGTEFVDSLVRVMENYYSNSNSKRDHHQSRAYATILLRSAFRAADPIQLVNARSEIFAAVVGVLRDRISESATKAALKFLIEVSPWGRNRIKAVEGGAVAALIELLLESDHSSSAARRATELAMRGVEVMCGCAEGRAEVVGHAAGLAVVSKKMLRVSHAATDGAVRIVAAVSRYSATKGVVAEMAEVGVVAKLCLLLQVDVSWKSKEKAREVLRAHSRAWRNSPCIPPHLISSFP
ncbi:unnamed protein product [Linum trigynum]|uniref:U-box domain-containing protein n=1 Tax=Linum trigynum TaxID=586398 RepID=A0AAV2FZH1_9ROSI